MLLYLTAQRVCFNIFIVQDHAKQSNRAKTKLENGEFQKDNNSS
jgi:hypothetical protein